MDKNYFRYILTGLLLSGFVTLASAQTATITLEQCYEFARTNYPSVTRLDLVAKTRDLDLQNVNNRFLPQLTFSGQATYQSQTISFPDALGSIPGASLPSISKDQYRIQAEVSQLLYDAGNTKNQKKLIEVNAALQGQNIEAGLYAIKQRINGIYFSILLIDEQLKQNELNKANLQTQVQKTEVAVNNGVAFQSSVNELKAEIININAIAIEYQSNRTGYLKMLSLFIGKELPTGTQLQTPQADHIQNEVTRPELKAFDLQKSVYDVQEKQLRSDYMPQVNVFFQGAYGRPTLNIIENKFGPWYITGLRLNWSLGSLYSLSNKKNILNLNRQAVDADRRTFLLNTSLDLTQQDEQVKKYDALIAQDEEAVALRASVTKSAEAQLANGVITVHEYIQKINAENLSKQTQLLHQVQLLHAKYNQKFISGN